MSADTLNHEAAIQLRQFVHDLTSPVQSIESCVGKMERTEVGVATAQKLQKLLRSSIDEIHAILTEADELARGALRDTAFLVGPAIRGEVDAFLVARDLPADSITLIAKHDFLVYGPRATFNRAVANLLKNAGNAIAAAQMSDPGRLFKIEVVVSFEGSEGFIQIQDNGVGIASDLLQAIWEEGYTDSPIKGTGTGMGIVKALFVDALGGDIAVESKQGDGTCFTIKLPVASSG